MMLHEGRIRTTLKQTTMASWSPVSQTTASSWPGTASSAGTPSSQRTMPCGTLKRAAWPGPSLRAIAHGRLPRSDRRNNDRQTVPLNSRLARTVSDKSLSVVYDCSDDVNRIDQCGTAEPMDAQHHNITPTHPATTDALASAPVAPRPRGTGDGLNA